MAIFFSSLRAFSALIFVGAALLWIQSSDALSAGASVTHRSLDLQEVLSRLPGLDARYPVIRDSPGLLENITEFLQENASLPKEELEAALRKHLCRNGYEAFCCSTCFTSTTTAAPVTGTEPSPPSTNPPTTDEATTEEATTEEATTEEATTEEATTEEGTTEEGTTEEATTEEATTEEGTTEEGTTEEATTEEATTEGSTSQPKPEEPCTITITTTFDCFAAFLRKIIPMLEPNSSLAVNTHLRGTRA